MRVIGRRRIAFLLVGLLLASCKEKPPEVLAGDGVPTKATRDVAGFSRISVSSKIQAEVTIGTASRLELEGDRNIVPHVTSRLANGTLTLDTDVKVKPSMALRARISVPRLDFAHATFGGVVTIQGLAAQKFETRVERAGKVNAKGSAQTLVLDGKDVGAIDFTKVTASSATVRLERAARADLGYLEKLDLTMSGATVLTYEGTPELKKAIQPPARLIQRDQ